MSETGTGPLRPGQGTLTFGATAHDHAEVTHVPPAQVLLLTNRNNLVEFLTRGLITPPAAMQKYYADLGEACPHALVLLCEDPSAELAEMMMRQSPTAFPVLLDLAIEAPAGTMQAGGAGDVPACMVIPGVLPLSAVHAVYFRSPVELMEFQIRDFSDVRAGQIQVDLAPHRFQGRSVNVEGLVSALSEAGQTVKPTPTERLNRASSLGGLLLLSAGVTQLATDVGFDPVRAGLEALQNPPDDFGKTLAQIEPSSGAHRWIALAPTLLNRQNVTAPAELLTSVDQPAAALLFAVAVMYLAELQPNEFVAKSAVADIREAYSREAKTLGDDNVPRIVQLLEMVEGVLRLSVDIDSFPMSEEPVVTGLLHVLLGDKPDTVAGLLKNSRHGSDASVVLAAAFAGALHGRSGVPVQLRGSAALEKLVDGLSADLINRNTDVDGPQVMGGEPIRIVREPVGKGRQVVLMRGPGGVLLRREEVPPPAPALGPTPELARPGDKQARARGKAPSRRSKKVTGVQEALVEGTHSSAENVETIGGQPELARTESPATVLALIDRLISGAEEETSVRRAAVQLCKLAHWDDCVVTTFALAEGQGFRVTGGSARIEVVLSGFVAPRVRIRAERFRERLTFAAWIELAESTRVEVSTMLQQSART